MAIDTLPLDFGRDKRFYVYMYRDPRPRKRFQPIYIGKGTAAHDRADRHWKRGSHNPILNRMLAKFRAARLTPPIEIVAWFDNENEAFSLEVALIAKFGRRDMKAGPLANLTDGGEGGSGHIVSDEARRRLAILGASISDETRAKRSAAMTGRTHTPDAIARMSASHKGRPTGPCSAEKKAKISAANMGNSSAKGVVRNEATRALMSAAQKLAVFTRKGNRRLPNDAAETIRRLAKNGVAQKQLASDFGVSAATISNIVNGRHASCRSMTEITPVTASVMLNL